MGAIVLALAAAGLVGGTTWYFTDKNAQQKLRRAKKALAKKAGELRVPRPGFAVHIPVDRDDFEVLDEVTAECFAELVAEDQRLRQSGFQVDRSREQENEVVQFCVAKKLYPDFQWPPISGDHPSVATLWTMIAFQVARHLATSQPMTEE